MTDLNDVILIGRITKDVGSDERSFSFVGNGTAKAIVSLAVNRSIKKGDSWEDEVSYIDCEIWGKTAENLKDKLVKGKQVCVHGYLKQDRWEKDGQKQSRLKVVAESVQLLGGGNKQDNGQNDGGYGDNPFGN
jgi:single-strand DNA-binding protein